LHSLGLRSRQLCTRLRRLSLRRRQLVYYVLE
jgi:hypothetical protein